LRGGSQRLATINSRVGLRSAALLLSCITAIGTAGFVLVEEVSWLDALYMTVMTISTVGFGDIAPATEAGRLFTVVLIITGVGAVLALISVIAGEILEGGLRDYYQRSSMMRKIEKEEHHVLVCGFGRYGKVVVDELLRAGRVVVIIEQDPSIEPELANRHLDYIIGSAADDEVLLHAAVSNADAIVIATSDEATSVFIALSARPTCSSARVTGPAPFS
jgi:voltage-gated potassium channel